MKIVRAIEVVGVVALLGVAAWAQEFPRAELALDWLASLAGDAGSGGSLPEGVIVVLARPRDEQPLGTANR